MYKHLLLALSLLGAASTAHAQKQKLDSKNGFRNYRFGDDISQHTDLVKKEVDGNTTYYTNPHESLKIGGADLKNVVIGFYKNKLFYVLIRTTGQLNSTRAKSVLEAQYGLGFQGNKYLPTYAWFGNNVTLVYDENSITHDAKIAFTGKTIDAQEEIAKKSRR